MSDELMNRARELLALRDKATPGPWVFVPHPTARDSGPWLVRPRVCYEIESIGDARLITAAHDMADTIRDLLAEVERLRRLAGATYQALAAANGPVVMLDNLSAATAGKELPHDANAGLPWDAGRDLDHAVANWTNESARAEVAEARLRELASAEPVAWVDGENFVWPKWKRRPSNCDALIRRPEMPK